MKTPRLALFALFAFASAAHAAMPTWPVIEEGPRSWARVFFTVGKDAKTLRCRYNECKPENKAQSNLFTIAPVGKATPTKVTIYKMVPRSKYNPRYYTDGPYEKVAEVINANAQPYASELSNFKLDNTGPKLVVVQGSVKYPATTDINEAQYNSYDQMKVAPPTKMVNDAIAKDEPATTPAHRDPAGRKPLTFWCDPATKRVTGWRKDTPPSTYIQVKDKHSACPPAGAAPVVVAPGDTKPDADASLALIAPVETRWLTKSQADNYASLRKDAKDAAAKKAVDSKFRDFVKVQIRPEAKSQYEAAYALPPAEAPKAIEAAIGKMEMWGGEVTAVVALFQEKADPATAKLLEIQLSKADWLLLSKQVKSQYSPALMEYWRSRGRLDGSSKILPVDSTKDDRAFEKDFLDPVALHLGAVAARDAVGSGVVPPKPEDGKLLALLDENQMKFLTPSEIENYLHILLNAPEPKIKDASVQAELKKLYAKIEARKGEPYPEGGLTEATFPNAPAWQKDKFCNPAKIGAQVANTGPKTTDVPLNAGGNVVSNLTAAEQKLKAERLASEQAAAKPLPDWAVGPCKGSPFSKDPVASTPATTPADSAINGPVGTAKTAIAVDKENEAKKKSEWLTQDLLVSAAKGGMVGLLVGSLFGPVGLIAGPLIGAALFYGLSKIMG